MTEGTAHRRAAGRVRLLCVALAGVAALSRAAAGTHCFTDPAAFRYEPLPADGSVDLVIDARTPTFEFQSGPSAFRAFLLPPVTHPYVVEVRSFLNCGPDPGRGGFASPPRSCPRGGADPLDAHVFYPIVAVLNDDFLVSRSTDLEALHFDLPLFEAATEPAYRVLLAIDPSNLHERYLVVYTPALLHEGRTLPPVTTPEAAAEASKIAFLGAARYGRLRITLRPGTASPLEAPAEPPAR